MNIELVGIEIDDVDGEEGSWGPSGQVHLKVNGKDYSITVHGCGEMDADGDDDLTEEECEAAFEFFSSNKEVNKAFPSDEYA